MGAENRSDMRCVMADSWIFCERQKTKHMKSKKREAHDERHGLDATGDVRRLDLHGTVEAA